MVITNFYTNRIKSENKNKKRLNLKVSLKSIKILSIYWI